MVVCHILLLFQNIMVIKKRFFSAFRSYSVEESGIDTNQSTKTWRMIKDKVAQAVEDYKSNRSTKDDDSDVDDFSEASVK